MALSTLSPLSGIGVTTRNTLLATGYLITLPNREDRYLLRGLQIEGWQLPELEVGISGLAGRARIAGFLGLNFFRRFSDVRVHIPTLDFMFSNR